MKQNTTIRTTITQLRIMQVALTKIEEEMKLSLNQEDYIEYLKLVSKVSQSITKITNVTTQNKTQDLNNNSNKVML